jgi:hypothetical protein
MMPNLLRPAVLTFFIAGLLIFCALSTSINLGAYSIPFGDRPISARVTATGLVLVRSLYKRSPNQRDAYYGFPHSDLSFMVAAPQTSQLDLLYASFSLLLFVCSMQLNSIHRFVFAVASILTAAGLWLSQRPRFAKLAMAASALALSFESLAWAWDHFIG